MHTKKTLVVLVLISSLLMSSASQAQEFVGYEGKNAIKEGEGGAKKTIAGIDFWSDGEPPFKYKLLGYLTDRRHKSGLIGKISMSGLEADIAGAAKKAGGDGVILISSQSDAVGTMHSGVANAYGNSASGFGVSRRVEKQDSKYAVVKYLKDAPAELSNPGTRPADSGAAPNPQ